MDMADASYGGYALCREMLESPQIVRRFQPDAGARFADAIRGKRALLLTGEGSSRVFPAKQTIYRALCSGNRLPIFSEGATQALEYDLSGAAVFGASNSGKTKEVVRLFTKLRQAQHDAVFAVVAEPDTPVIELSNQGHVLTCGKEAAVAATKSVIEQALFFASVEAALGDVPLLGLDELSDQMQQVLELRIDAGIVQKLARAPTIYFAGRNNGVAEELRLKTNEIARKKADYLEGTYAVHGIEEVMLRDEVVVLVDPFAAEEAKLRECLVDGVGMHAVALAPRQTSFPTVRIPDGGTYRGFVELCAGWNLLVETGLATGIDLDHPARARKVGNEFEGR